MGRYVKMEVRCCCQPEKLLGWMEVDPNSPGISLWRFPKVPLVFDGKSLETMEPERLFLPIAIFSHNTQGKDETYLAIKAEGVGIETLREIPGFVENI